MDTKALALVVIAACAIGALTPLAESAAQRSSTAEINIAMRNPQHNGGDASASDGNTGKPGVQVSPSSGAGRSVNIRVLAEDDNGHNDVTQTTVTIYKSDQATVHIPSTAATKSSGSGRSATWNAAVSMNYYDEAGNYWIKAEVTDRDGTVTTKWTNFTYESLAAIGLSSSAVSLNPGGDTTSSVSPGGSTHANPLNVSVLNHGNVRVDLQYSGSDLSNGTLGTSIPLSNIHVSRYANMSGEVALSTIATTDTDFDLAPGSSSTKNWYVAIHMPTGLPPGKYTGNLTLGAVSG